MPSTKALTNADVLASQGLVEIVNPDGSRSQVKISEAKNMISGLENLKKQLKNLPNVEEEAEVEEEVEE